MIYGMNERDGPTGSRTVADLACSSRLLQSAKDILGEDAYLFHTKCNLKEAITGEIWQWHQDFGVWHHDGLARPDLVTILLMLDEATELGGCMYFVPGSHKEGDIAGVKDGQTTSGRAGRYRQSTEMTGLVRAPWRAGAGDRRAGYGRPVPSLAGTRVRPQHVDPFPLAPLFRLQRGLQHHDRGRQSPPAVQGLGPSAVPLQVRDDHATPQAA